MKNIFLKKSILIFILISILSFSIRPEIIFAQNFDEITSKEINTYLELPEKEVQELIESLPQILTSEGINLLSSGYSTDEEIAAILTLRKGARVQILNHLLIDAPIEITGKIIKVTAEVARIFLTKDVVSAIFKKFEEESVKRAVEYGMKALLQNEIRVTPGALSFSYPSYKGNQQKVVFQYLITYQPVDERHGNVVIRIYSPTSIEPPKSQPWLMAGVYHELTHDLPPFIIEIDGSLENFKWADSPSIKVTFPEQVPDLGIRPLSFFDRNVADPIKNGLKETVFVFKKLFGKTAEGKEKIQTFGEGAISDIENALNAIKTKTENLWNKFKKTVSQFNPFGAAVGFFSRFDNEKTTILESSLKETESELEKLRKDLSFLEEKLENEEGIRNELKEKYGSEITKITGTVDNLAEMVDDFDQRMAELSEIKTTSKKPSEQQENLDETEQETIFCEKREGDLSKRNKIIFNEIGWMGTEVSPNDEWIEFKNISSSAVNLAGWQILDKDGQIKINFSNGDPVSANGFYLLERTDDNSAPNVSANKIYTGSLNDTNEAIYLFNENCELEDEVLASPTWPAGDKSSKRTMERKNDLSWQTSSNSGGTPKFQNSSGYFFASGGGGGGGTGTGAGAGAGSGGGSSGGGGGTASIPTYCSQENLSSPTYQPIIINEVAWMGTSVSSSNEWIELKNISANEINLTDWQLLDKDKEIKIIFSSGDRVSANGFYLLERTDDNSVPGISADKIYTGNLEDSNESLRLFDQNCNLIDEVIANSNWPAGNKDERRSMERDSNLNWHDYFGSGANGIFGTPKVQNSQPVQPILKVSPESLEFSAIESGQNPQSQIFNIENIGSGTLDWIATIEYVSPPIEGVNWLSLDFNSGTAPSEVSVSVDISSLESGNYSAILKIEAPGAQNSPREIPVTLSLAVSEFLSPVDHLIISEVQLADNEFVELFNPTNSPIDLNSFYFSYFSSGRNWNDTWRNKKFPDGTTILSKNYFLIGLKGYPTSDWQAYETNQLNNENGAVAIFSCDPKNTEENPKTIEEATTCKIDALGWGETIVKETESTIPAPAEKSLARKIGVTNEGYLTYTDSDNNLVDFEIQEPTPKAINQHPYSDLDNDGIIDSFDPETIVAEEITLEAGEYNFKNLIIEENGKLILNSDSSSSGFKGVKIKAENLTLNENSLISADGTGYPVEEGLGSGKESQTGGGSCSGYNYCWFSSGGGYGGIGGQGSYSSCGAVVDGGISFGDLKMPIDLGSGGGGDTAGAGGGAIQIEVTNTLILNGQISANGEEGKVFGACGGSGGGSGGSIYITTYILEGSGQIFANGGSGYDNLGGGGAGGRVAIYYDSKDSFPDDIQAFGGQGFKSGGPGTIFLKALTQTSGDLIIDNNNFDGATQFAENYTFDNLEVLNSSHLYLPENLTTTNLEVGNNTVLEALTATTINVNQFLISQNSSLLSPSQIFITINSDNFSLQTESKILANIEINVDELLIDSTSAILADGKGYPGGQGPGVGKEGRTGGGSCSGYNYCWYGSGAGYGGQGGQGSYPSCHATVDGGLLYGSQETPIDFGSGGGNQGGAGGGVIKINVINDFTLNGSLSVNGEDGKVFGACGGSGGGSGGSIYIITNILEGSGQIRADGGQGYDNLGGGGAGGRIAIYFQTNNFKGDIQTQGGGGYQAGQDGTMYLGE